MSQPIIDSRRQDLGGNDVFPLRRLMAVISWLLLTASVIAPVISDRRYPYRFDRDLYVWPLSLVGIFGAGFLMGSTTARRWQDLFYAWRPFWGYPITGLIAVMVGPGGDAGMGVLFMLVVSPLILVPVYFIGARAGLGLSEHMHREGSAR